MVKRLFRILEVIVLLYLFFLGIKLLGASFKSFGKGFAEELIRSSSNPFVGLFIGVLATSIIHSSSTTTAIVVGMVGGGILSISNAVPIVMGANIGTTVTNLTVSFTMVTRKQDFRRAFSGAVVHDFFNLLSVLVLFPLEITTHFLENGAIFLTRAFAGAGGVQFTSPFKVILEPSVEAIMSFFLRMLSLPGLATGIITAVLAFSLIIFSLVMLVKLMRRLLVQRIEISINKYLFRNDFTAFLLGMILTATIQSSGATTSLMVPLVGAGVVSLNRAYPYTLGANVGTTVTALLASLATVTALGDGTYNTTGVTIAIVHLLFNIFGIAIFYPLKKLPIHLALKVGELVARVKHWMIILIVSVFYFLPLIIIFIGRIV